MYRTKSLKIKGGLYRRKLKTSTGIEFFRRIFILKKTLSPLNARVQRDSVPAAGTIIHRRIHKD